MIRMLHETRAHPSSGRDTYEQDQKVSGDASSFRSESRRGERDLNKYRTGVKGRQRLTSRVNGSGMEAEQLHLVFLAFAFPRFLGDVLHGGNARGERDRSLSDRLQLRFFSSYPTAVATPSSREHLNVR